MPYRTLVQSSHDFYMVAGSASATLVGLLFVGLSLHLRAVLARPEVRGLARSTLANFGQSDIGRNDRSSRQGVFGDYSDNDVGPSRRRPRSRA